MNALLEVDGAVKRYGAVEALRGVDLRVAEGKVHAICGDNGAGKSTLIKLIAGVETIDSGTMRLRGEDLRPASPTDSLHAGIATIHQDLAVAPRMSIAQNIFMGSEIVRRVVGFSILDKAEMRRQSLSHMASLNVPLTDMDAPVDDLSGGQRQAVALCRALRWNAEVVIMDEPTAALGVRETETVLDLIRSLRDSGKTVLLISHNMADVVAVADAISILRNGRNQADLEGGSVSADDLAHLILSGAGTEVDIQT